LAIELVLDVVHFCMNGQNVSIYLGLKGSTINNQFMIGFFLVGWIHEGMMGGSTEKKSREVIYTTTIREMRGDQWDKWEIRVSGRVWVHKVKKD
jgi:hypothetical protein